MPFAETLKRLRADAGLTQAALSVASGVSLSAIREYEQGNKEPGLRAAAKLARALGVSVAELAKGVEDGAGAAPSPRPSRPRRSSPKKKRPARS
jgi:transcriptional regulator with XRE-family HTH domain